MTSSKNVEVFEAFGVMGPLMAAVAIGECVPDSSAAVTRFLSAAEINNVMHKKCLRLEMNLNCEQSEVEDHLDTFAI